MNKFVIASILVLLFSSAGFSQSDQNLGIMSIKTANGFLFVNNNKDKSFSVEVSGKEVEAVKDAGVPAFLVDGELVQILSVPLTNFAPENNGLSDVELLDAHQKWESNYLGEEVYEAKLTVASERGKVGDRKTLFWGFVRPGFNDKFKQDYFLTTIIGKTLLGLGSSLTENKSKDSARELLSKIMATLKVSDKPFDIKKLSDSIRNS